MEPSRSGQKRPAPADKNQEAIEDTSSDSDPKVNYLEDTDERESDLEDEDASGAYHEDMLVPDIDALVIEQNNLFAEEKEMEKRCQAEEKEMQKRHQAERDLFQKKKKRIQRKIEKMRKVQGKSKHKKARGENLDDTSSGSGTTDSITNDEQLDQTESESKSD